MGVRHQLHHEQGEVQNAVCLDVQQGMYCVSGSGMPCQASSFRLGTRAVLLHFRAVSELTPRCKPSPRP